MGVSTKNIAPNPAIRLERTAYGLLLHERKAIRDIGRNQPPATQQARRPEGIYIRSDNRNMVQLDNLIELTGGIAPPETVPLQPFRFCHHLRGTCRREDHRTRTGQKWTRLPKETLDETFRTALTGDSKEYRRVPPVLMFRLHPGHRADLPDSLPPSSKAGTRDYHVDGASRHCWRTGIPCISGGITMNIFSQIGIIMLIGL